jgi:hypothetical protein
VEVLLIWVDLRVCVQYVLPVHAFFLIMMCLLLLSHLLLLALELLGFLWTASLTAAM